MSRRLPPYAIAIGGAVIVTAVISALTAVATASSLAALYLLLVLWLATRWGRGPAVMGSVAAFLLYDFFFVPPVGTFTVRGTAELLELVVLLTVALVTSQLAASLRRARAAAEALAVDSRQLYELATAALRTPEVGAALSLVADRAERLESVERFSVVAIDFGQAVHLAGASLEADGLRQATWSYENGRPVGVSIKDVSLNFMRVHGGVQADSYLPMASGVAVLKLRPAHQPSVDDRRMLAALIGLAGLLLDRRRAALEAERARALEASDRLKAAILSSLSHELKSPIAALRTGLTALTAPRAGLSAEQRELLRDMDRQASRLDRMVGDMLALSRLEAGVQLDREAQSFADLAAASIQQLRGQMAGREVVLRIPEDLPPVEVDELQVGRVVTNLLENALDWTPTNGVIEVGARATDTEIEAWVENDGPAIPAADLGLVFDTFWTRRARGTGLGLAICKRVVEAHGGSIRAENRRRGPRFTFTLPLARVHAET